MRVVSLYIAPLFLLGVGMLGVVPTIITPTPQATDFSEVRGHLQSYYIYSPLRYPKTIMILNEGHRLWTTELDQGGADAVFKKRGAEIRTYVLPNSTNFSIDGAVKAYGLWINGKQLKSLEEEIASGELVIRVGLPALSIFLIALAVFIHLKSRRKYAANRHAPPNTSLEGTAN